MEIDDDRLEEILQSLGSLGSSSRAAPEPRVGALRRLIRRLARYAFLPFRSP
jgi:hypothetical protein